jgi:hypothetical protein
MFPLAISGNQEVIPKPFRSGQSLAVPLNLLIEWHNLSPLGSEIREQIKSYLVTFGEVNEKAHWSRGLVVQEDDDLKIDNQLWDYAIYRGKQETYIKSANENFDKLQSDLATIACNQEREAELAKALGGRQGTGTPLVPVRDLSETARRLQAGSAALKVTVDRMGLGMIEALAPPASTDHTPAEPDI